MNLQELKIKKPPELLAFAEEQGVEGAAMMRRQELMFAILQKVAAAEQAIFGTGTIEVLPDGFGYLRSMEANYLPGADDIYVSPTQVRKFGLRTGDTVEGEIRAPQGRRALLRHGADQQDQLRRSRCAAPPHQLRIR